MRITDKSIYIYKRDRRIYTKGNKFYYIYKNNYRLISSKMLVPTGKLGSSKHKAVFRGGVGEQDYNTFIQEKNDNLKLIALIKHYEEICDHIEMNLRDLLNYINNGIKFLNDNRDKILTIIDGYKNEELSRAEAMILISTIKKVLFTNIFENYFLEIIANANASGAPDNITDIIEALSITSDNSSLTKKIIEIKETIEAFKSYKTIDTDYKDYFTNKRTEIEKKTYENTDDDKDVYIASLNLSDNKAPAIVTEIDDNKKKLKKIFVKLFKLRETAYWWKIIEQTIDKELNVADDTYKSIIDNFLKEMLKISINKELLDNPIVNRSKQDDELEQYKTYLQNLQEKLILNMEPNIKILNTYEGAKKESYEKIIVLLNKSSTTLIDQEPSTAVITKTDMKSLTNSMIILLKFQIYDLYKIYEGILDTCDLDKIKAEIAEFNITFKDENSTTSQPPPSSRSTLA
jgi:hypothetical protein